MMMIMGQFHSAVEQCCRYLGNSPQDLYRTYDTFKDMWTSNRLALDDIILRAIRGQKRSNKGVCVCVQLKCEFCASYI